MIKMISGVYGMRVKQPHGGEIIKGVGPDYGPFSLTAEQEKRLVDRGVVVYVDLPATVEDPAEIVDTEAPIGFDEMPPLPEGVTAIPEYNADMKAPELREIGAMCGLTFKVGMSKKAMVEALDAHIAANMADDEDEDGELAPVFDAAEAVQ